jgi:molybdopterin converting factor small subunit
MRVRIEVSSGLRRHIPDYDARQGVVRVLPPGARLDELLVLLGLPADEVSLLMVNRAAVKGDRRLEDGDLVGIFPTMEGG